MDVQIRPVGPDRWEEYVRSVFLTFGERPRPQDVDDARIEFEPGRSMAAFDDDRIVGTASMLSLRMAVPGGAQVATAGLTTVGVQPTHRRRTRTSGVSRSRRYGRASRRSISGTATAWRPGRPNSASRGHTRGSRASRPIPGGSGWSRWTTWPASWVPSTTGRSPEPPACSHGRPSGGWPGSGTSTRSTTARVSGRCSSRCTRDAMDRTRTPPTGSSWTRRTASTSGGSRSWRR